MTLDITNHSLVPKHMRVSDAEKEKLYALYNITSKKLPKIIITDPAIAKLTVKVGDIIKIEHHSKTAGLSSYYREVADE
ncbi:MAG: DNA-directed RNA polymerase subunit RpoH/Rpb5 C-terminal domain-containing protein [Nanoarchaeota archaeon]|nr:DNA-directed RNA polymerase subunit RpoH/Rpb5 C-terminal domain-containing protein [Nanoarchaeota archaeon]